MHAYQNVKLHCLFQFEHTGKNIKSLEADVLNCAHKLLLQSMAAMFNCNVEQHTFDSYNNIMPHAIDDQIT